MIAIEDLAIAQGRFNRKGLSFHVPTGSYAAIMGRTGSGKTSVLEIICGLRRPVAGRVILGGVDVTPLTPAARRVGYVPQDLALFTTLTVEQNIAFGPRMLGLPDQARRVDEILDWLGLTHLRRRYPANLSGGESQRVALGRALATGPRVLLLDEPLGALDAQTRHEMYSVLDRVRRRAGVTVLHVTHNRDEADQLADVLLTLDDAGFTARALSPQSTTMGEPC